MEGIRGVAARPGKAFWAVAGLLLSMTAAARAEQSLLLQPRIVNGVITGDFPTTGALLTPANTNLAQMVCSGTLIGCETFLTAAHCVCPTDGVDCTGANPPDPSAYLVYLQHGGFFTVTGIELRSDYDFPIADVAVLKLGNRVEGIRPTPIDTTGIGLGVNGIIAGFGRTGGSASDYGIKRAGAVITASCPSGVSDVTSVCWDFVEPLGAPGEDSNTCNGDSGGPLFVDLGAGPVVAGVTSGGETFNCLPTDHSFDSRVSHYAGWIQTEGGADLSNTSCGDMPQVGDAAVTVLAFSGQLGGGNPQATQSFTVPAGTSLLRVSLNAIDNGLADFDLYVKAGSPPSPSSFDCAAAGPNQFGFCEFAAPAAGTWHVLVDRFSGSGPYQATATVFGIDCSLPGQEGEPCDDGNVCTVNDACVAGTCIGTPATDGAPCDDGNPCTSNSCQDGACESLPLTGAPCSDASMCTRNDLCQAGICVGGPAPAIGCKQSLTARRSVLLLKDKATDRDKLLWKWVRGESTTLGELGNPTLSSAFALCLYDDSDGTPELVAEKLIPTGGAWGTVSGGFKYVDPRGLNNGISKIVLKAGADQSAKITLRGKGNGLGFATLPVAQLDAVLVQLVNENACWEGHFTNTSSSPGEFRAKGN
jgi:hypothetical protein